MDRQLTRIGLLIGVSLSALSVSVAPAGADARPSGWDAGQAYLGPDVLAMPSRCASVDGYRNLFMPERDAASLSALWTAANEPPLYQQSRHPNEGIRKTLRFTWLRSFDPAIVVRVDELNDGGLRMVAKRMSGEAGFGVGTLVDHQERRLTAAEAARLSSIFNQVHLSRITAQDCPHMKDGASWIFEQSSMGYYSIATRQSPNNGQVRKLGLVFLNLTGWRVGPVY